MNYYLGIDIGASSGRHILGSLQDHKLVLEEVYRFKNGIHKENGHWVWDMERLEDEIIQGLQAAKEIGKAPRSISIDTWGVDYVLLDKDGHPCAPAYAYRDDRSIAGVEAVDQKISREDLYAKNGIQYQPFNTIYQLACMPEDLKEAEDLLMIPDYLAWKLTGQKSNEYSNLSTTGLLDQESGTLKPDLLNLCKASPELFQTIKMPGDSIGPVSRSTAEKIGYETEVLAAPSHDTASAYLASPCEQGIILSSGTWSLLGQNLDNPIQNEAAWKANFTNERGYEKAVRFLKNIMGMWIIQEVSRNLDGKYSFGELVDLARESDFEGIFDVDDPRFLKPDNMMEEIRKYFIEKDEPAPQSVGDIARTVYQSLAAGYEKAIAELEEITGQKSDVINIIGGGCQNQLLNEMIAEKTGKTVAAGPVEATAIGNILCQMLADGTIKDLQEAREIVRDSFDIQNTCAKA